MTHASIVAVCKCIPASCIEKCLFTIERLSSRIEFGDSTEILGITHILVNINGHAANRICNARKTIKINLGIMRDFDPAELIDNLHHTCGSIIKMYRIDLHLRTLPRNIGITRNGKKRHPFLSGINARQDNRIGSVFRLSGTTIGSQQQNIVWIRINGLLFEGASKVIVNNPRIVEAGLNAYHP